jgi:hypothetical protein
MLKVQVRSKITALGSWWQSHGSKMMSPPTTALALSRCARMVPPFLLLSLCGCFLGDRCFTADPRLPDRVRKISLESQKRGAGLSDVHREIKRGAGLSDVHREIRASYGEPTCQSGTSEQWNIDDGVLTFSPIAGVFFISSSGEMIRVVRKQNPLEQSLFGSYEMVTRPDARHEHTRYWLGDVDLRANGTYVYRDSQQFPEQRADQGNNFFMRHPSGTYQLDYLYSYGPKTLLESIRGHKRVARLTFCGSNGVEKPYFIARKADLFFDKLVFESDESMEFEMDMCWDTHWE